MAYEYVVPKSIPIAFEEDMGVCVTEAIQSTSLMGQSPSFRDKKWWAELGVCPQEPSVRSNAAHVIVKSV